MKYQLIILLLFSTFKLVSQDENQLYEIRQYCNSEQSLLSIIDNPSPNAKVVILFEPNACPRCESSFKVLNDYLLLDNVEYEYLVLSDKLTTNLLKKYDYLEAKLSTINKSELRKIFKFNFSEDHIQVPFILKINERGQLVNSKAMLGINVDGEFVKNFIKSSDFNCAENIIKNNWYRIEEAQLTSCSQILNSKQFETLDYSQFFKIDNEKFAVIERSNGIIQMIDIGVDSIWYTIQSTDRESFYFNEEVPDHVMKSLIDYNILKTIYLKILNANENSLTVIASLPLVSKEPTGYGYYNQPVILTKNWDGDILNIEEIDFTLEDGYVLKHAKSFSNNDGTICFKLVKGWPAVGTKDQNDIQANLDVNSNLFYENAYEYKCICDDGLSFDLGALTEKHSKLKIGYYFDYTGIQFYHDRIIYWNGIDGDINIYDTNKNVSAFDNAKVINIFPKGILTKNCNQLDSVTNLEDVQLREECFPYKIKTVDFDFENRLMFSILSNDNSLSLHLNDLETGESLSYVNLDVLNIEYTYDFFIYKMNSDFYLYLIYEANGKYYKSKFTLIKSD